MSRGEEFFTAVDRYWLQVIGRRYRVDVRLDLRRELDKQTLDALDETVEAVDAILADTDYEPAIYEVKPLQDDDTASAVYSGRVDGRPQIELDSYGENIPEAMAHELGHDAVEALDAAPDATPLVKETYDEMIAGLTARATMDRIAHNGPPTLDPFSPEYEPEWKRINGVLDSENRELEDRKLQKIRDAADRRDWSGMVDAAEHFGKTPPATGSVTDRLTYTVPSSMAAQNLFDDAYTAKHAVETISRSWRWMERAKNDDATALLTEVRDSPENKSHHLVRAAAEREEDLTQYTEIMRAALDASMAEYTEAVSAEIPETPEAVVDAFSKERYGQNPETGEDREDYLDLPHTVGDQLAAILYDRDIGPETVLTASERAGTLCLEALTYTVSHAQQDITGNGYRLDSILDPFEKYLSA